MKYILSLLRLAARLPFLMSLLVAPGCAFAAALNLNAAGGQAVWTAGGVYTTIAISGSSQPSLAISGGALTLTGTSSSAGMITGPSATKLMIDGVRLSLGSATSAPGGVISGSVTLLNNGALRVYGRSSGTHSIYLLRVRNPSTGAVSGSGTITLRSGAILQTGAIGLPSRYLPSISMEPQSRLSINDGLWVESISIDSASVSALTGEIHARNVVLSGSGASLVAERGNIVVGSLTSTSPTDELFAQNALEADEGSVEITGELRLPAGLTRIAAEGDVTIHNGTATPASGGLGEGALYVRAGGNVNVSSGYLHKTTIEALKMTVGDDLTAANVLAAQLSAKSAAISGNLIVTGNSLEIFGHKVSYGLLELDSGNSGSASSVAGDLTVSDSEIHTGSLDVGGNADIRRARGSTGNLNVKGDFIFRAGTLATGDLSARDIQLGDRQYATSLNAGAVVAKSISADRNTVNLNASSIAVSGSVSGGENFTVTASGDVRAGSLEAGRLEAANTEITAGALTLSGSAPSVVHGSLSITGKGAAASSGTFQSLEVGKTLAVASAGLAGKNLKAAEIVVAGGASGKLSVENLSQGATLAAGRNGQASLGQATPAWLDAALAGVKRQDSSALGVYAPVALGGAGVDGQSAAPARTGEFYFAPGSMLVINAENARESAHPDGIISAPAASRARVASGAMLLLEGVSANSVYGVLGANIETEYAGTDAWEGANLETASHLIAARKIEGRNGWFTTIRKPAASVYPDLDPGIFPPLDGGIEGGVLGSEIRHYDSEYAGVRFLSRVGGTTYMDHEYREAVKTLESATRIAMLGAVPQMTLAANTAALEAAEGRSCFEASPQFTDELSGHSFALWLLPLWHSLNAREFPVNNFNYDVYGNLGGSVFGADWTFASGLRAGLDASIGGGYAKSGGDLAKTVNNMGFAGIGAYTGWDLDGLILSAGAHYTESWNSIRQELPRRLRMRDITGEFTSRAFSASLRGSYKLSLGENWSLAPHAGARFAHLITDNYTVYSNGALLDGDRIVQNIWTFPAGLELSATYGHEHGWSLSSSLDVGVIPAAGDLSGKTKVRYTGVPGEGEVESQIMDYTVFYGSLGLEWLNGDLTLGLRGNLKMGMHGEAASLFGLLRWEF